MNSEPNRACLVCAGTGLLKIDYSPVHCPRCMTAPHEWQERTTRWVMRTLEIGVRCRRLGMTHTNAPDTRRPAQVKLDRYAGQQQRYIVRSGDRIWILPEDGQPSKEAILDFVATGNAFLLTPARAPNSQSAGSDAPST